MIRDPPIYTRSYTLCPYPTLFRSVQILLRRQLAELRPGDGLRRMQAKLHVLGEIPGQSRRRKPIDVLDLRRDDIGAAEAEQVDRRHALQTVLEADAGLEPQGRHQLGLQLPVDAEDFKVGLDRKSTRLNSSH